MYFCNMTQNSNNNGRAYEYACLNCLYDAIIKIRPAKILENSSYQASQNAWNNISEAEHVIYNISANSTIDTIFDLEPNIIEKTEDQLNLYIQDDSHGIEGDVRDIIIERKEIVWEIGLSIKHNHEAVKHCRLSNSIDFGKKWYGVNCSEQYWKDVSPIFDFLETERKKGTLFDELDGKEDRVYLPILSAFKNELSRAIQIDKTIPTKLVEYLLGKYDFYKIISIDSIKVTTIQPFNMHGTLNKKSRVSEPQKRIPLISIPQKLAYLDFKQDSKNTILMVFESGWLFSFRIHNAEKRVIPSLKFDVQIIGMPADVNIKINCKWNI